MAYHSPLRRNFLRAWRLNSRPASSIASLRLNANSELFVMALVPNVPLVLPLPTCSVPALMVVVPV